MNAYDVIPLILGFYFMIDGLFSYLYFYPTATNIEQTFRIIRLALGLLLVIISFVEKKKTKKGVFIRNNQ